MVTTAELKHSDLTEKLINVYYCLYNELGYGFLESIYQKAFVLMLKEQAIGFRKQAPIRVTFHGIEMAEFFADLLVDDCVLVELKAVRALEQAHERQLLKICERHMLKLDYCSTSVQGHSSGGSHSIMIEKAGERVQLRSTALDIKSFHVNPRPIRAIRVLFSVRFRTASVEDEQPVKQRVRVSSTNA